MPSRLFALVPDPRGEFPADRPRASPRLRMIRARAGIARGLAGLLAALALSAVVNAQVEQPEPPPAEDGLTILRRAIEAHGGNTYEDLSDVAVSFSGRWGRIGPRLRPILADREFRVASEERYVLAEGVGYQWHLGPEGEKTVLRGPDNFEVRYNGRVSRDRNRLLASAASIDLYEFLLIGPSWLTRREVSAELVGSDKLGGEDHLLLRVAIEPGFGVGARDELILWLRESNHVMQRVQVTLSGFPPLGDQELEITLGGHRWIDGKLWPTEFLQRVEAAVKVVYHRWEMTGFDSDRGITAEDLAEIKQRTETSPVLRPARALGLDAED